MAEKNLSELVGDQLEQMDENQVGIFRNELAESLPDFIKNTATRARRLSRLERKNGRENE